MTKRQSPFVTPLKGVPLQSELPLNEIPKSEKKEEDEEKQKEDEN